MCTDSTDTESTILPLLCDLGLSAAEAQLYVSILLESQGVSGGMSLGRSRGAPDARLRSLCDHGLIMLSQAANGEHMATPLDPKIVSRALYLRHLWAACPDEWDQGVLQPDVAQRLGTLHATCTTLEAALARHYRQLPPERGVVVVPGNMVSQKLALVLRSAASTIDGITAPLWAPRLDLVWAALKDRMGTGVHYRRLSDDTTFIAFGQTINVRDTNAYGVELRVLPRGDIREKFFVCDGQCAFAFWPAQPGAAFPLEATVTYLDVLVRSCRDSFAKMWDRAVLGATAIEILATLRAPFVARCIGQRPSDSMAELANGLFEWGKFFFDDCSAAERDGYEADLQSLRLSGLVVPSPDDPTRMIPNLLSEFRSAILPAIGTRTSGVRDE